jgi:hypothetical protein
MPFRDYTSDPKSLTLKKNRKIHKDSTEMHGARNVIKVSEPHM